MGAEDVLKGLRRNDAEVAVAALLKLPPEGRAPFAEPVGALFRASVVEAHARGDWSRLGFWVARAAKEESLAGPPSSDDAVRCWWALLWGAVRTKDFPRAELAWQRVEPLARSRAPALAEPMRAFVESQGQKVSPVVGVPSPSVDPRLGYEAKTVKRALPPLPTSLEGVEPAVLALCALQGWGVFADTIESWAKKVAPALAAPLKVLGVRLAIRELLLRARVQGAIEAPAVLIGRLLREGVVPPELGADVLNAFRLVSSSLPKGPFSTEAAARAYCLLGSAAAAYAENVTLVARSFGGRLFTPAAASSGLRLAEELSRAGAGLEPSVQLHVAFKGLQLWRLTQVEEVPPLAPEWLARAFERVAAERTALTAHLNGASPKELLEDLRVLGETLPTSTVETCFEAAWDGASEAARKALALLMHLLMERVSDGAAFQDAKRRVAKAQGEEEVEAIIDELFGGTPPPMSPAGVRLVQRHAATLASVDADFLLLALEGTRSAREARAMLERFIDGKGSVAMLEAASVAANADWGALSLELEDRAIATCKGDTRALAEAFHAAQMLGAPKTTLRRVGRPLLTAFAQSPSDAPTVKRAVQFAKKAGARLTKKRAPKGKKAAKSEEPEIPF